MTEVLNASISISSSLLLKYNEFVLEAQQSHSNAIEEIALQMDVDFIDFNEFSDVYEIRSDLYGDNVRNAFWKKTSKSVVLKYVPGYSIEEHHRKLVEEIRCSYQNQSCENIIQLLGITEDLSDRSAVLVIQRPKDGTLREYLLHHPNLEWSKRLNLAKSVAQGIRHLHSSGIAHGCLHSQSVFVEDGKAVIRDPRLFSFEDDETSTSSSLNSAVLSTIPFVDPQVMGDMKHKPDQRSDIYGLGVIMWEISSGLPPFYNSPYGHSGNQVLLTMSIMVKKTREQPIPNTPESYVRLYQQCWDHEPELRPNIDQVCDRLEALLHDEPVMIGKSLINGINIPDIRVSSEDSRKSHDYLQTPSLSSSQLQSSQNPLNQDSNLSGNEYGQHLQEKLQPSISDDNLGDPISSPTEFEKSNNSKKSRGIKIFKSKFSKISKISKIFKKLSCFS